MTDGHPIWEHLVTAIPTLILVLGYLGRGFQLIQKIDSATTELGKLAERVQRVEYDLNNGFKLWRKDAHGRPPVQRRKR